MCLKGVSEVSKKKATHQCEKCRAYSDTKGHLCKPMKLTKAKDAAKPSKSGKAKKNKKGKKNKGKKSGKKK